MLFFSFRLNVIVTKSVAMTKKYERIIVKHNRYFSLIPHSADFKNLMAVAKKMTGKRKKKSDI